MRSTTGAGHKVYNKHRPRGLEKGKGTRSTTGVGHKVGREVYNRGRAQGLQQG